MLSYHPTAELAMEQVCKQTIPAGVDNVRGGWANDTPAMEGNAGRYAQGLGDCYIFLGVEADVETNERSYGYASRFAAFIEEHELGVVARGQKVFNTRYHPTYKTQAFIWNPNREKLVAWWSARLAAAEAARVNAAAKIVATGNQALAI